MRAAFSALVEALFRWPAEVSDVSAQRFATPAHQYFIGISSALSRHCAASSCHVLRKCVTGAPNAAMR
jgi:hypothetical protein